jgi:hypothetical protein
VGITVGSNLPDSISSVNNEKIGGTESKNILKHYHPNHPKWPSDFKNSYNFQFNDYLLGKNVLDRCVVMQFLKPYTKLQMFEPLFVTLTVYAFTGEVFVRLTESRQYDITPPNIRDKYPFIYKGGKFTATDESNNFPLTFSVPVTTAHDDLFVIAQVNRILANPADKAPSAYQKGVSTLVQSDIDKHVESCFRLKNYRQSLAFSVIKVFDNQYRCSQNGGASYTCPLYVVKQPLSDAQIGLCVREIFPCGHMSTIPTPTKMETLDGDLKFILEQYKDNVSFFRFIVITFFH